MAQADGGGALSRNRSVSGAALLSALLHAGAAILLIGFQAAPRPDEMPEPLAVEVVLEAPSPPVPSSVPEPSVAEPLPAPAKSTAHAAPAARLRAIPASRPSPPAAVLPESGEAAPQAPAVATAPVAAPVAAPAALAEAVDYGAYVGRLHERIARYRVYPPQAMRRREEGDVRLRILLAGDGSLLDILSLAEASVQLTRAARQAIESAAPFDPPPRGGGGERRLAFDVTVAFRLR